MAVRVGFIGFGEVASVFSVPVVKSGASVAAYDTLLLCEGGREILDKRTRIKGIQFQPLQYLIENTDYIISTVTTDVAVKVAEECTAYLKPRQFYIDMNSTSPGIKVTLDRIISSTGASFAEGAVLGAVGASGEKTRILMGGANGREAAAALAAMGLNTAFYSPVTGKASMFKMLRSIFSKGMEALLLEMLTAGRRAGMEEDLWKDITGLFTDNHFEMVASNWIKTHPAAHERRYHEMIQVIETMHEIGIEPVMTAGTEAFFKRSCSIDMKEAFSINPTSVETIIDFMEKSAKGAEAK